MCVGENLAPLAIHYLNSQLSGLYDNAIHCVEHHGDASRPENAYAHALAQFSYGVAVDHETGVQFNIVLAKPTLDFVCNHDAILRLHIKNGHFTHYDHKISQDCYYDLQDIAITLRVPFVVRKLLGGDEKIGNGKELLIPLLILDIQNYKILSFEPEIQQGRESFVSYLTRYLECLYGAGNHVMFSLPDFDDKDGHPAIDYALLEHKLSWPVETINGISVAEVNKQLSLKWLKAAMISSGPVDVFEASWREAVLAEYHSFRVAREDVGCHYHLKFGAPRIEALCPNEVVMYFHLDELFCYDGPDFSVPCEDRFEGWEIAVIFEVVYTIEAEGNVTTLDLTHPRFFQHLCAFKGIDMHNEVHIRYWHAICEFFSAEYLDLLHSVGGFMIYHQDKRWNVTVPKFDASRQWVPAPDEEVPNEIVADTHMDNFDQIITISQQSINVHFSTLWSYAQGYLAAEYACTLTRRWAYGEEFSVDFQPLSVRFLSGDKALVWVHLGRAVLRAQENAEAWRSGKDYEVIDWRLAFEVDIRMDQVDDSSKWNVSEEWRRRFSDTHLWKTHGSSSDCIFKHIWLDFENARFIHEFSSFGNLYDARDSLSSIGKLQAVFRYVQQHYFPALSFWGLNIIYSVPVWQSGATPPSYALTDVAFHVYSRSEITRQTWAQVPAGYEPILIILGMTAFRAPPSPALAYNAAWLLHANRGWAHGKLALSKRVFVQERLLALLSRVNAETTLIPRFVDVEKGVWDLNMVVWREHEKRKHYPPDFNLVGLENGYLIYRWEYLDGWTYEHQGLGDLMDGWYTVSCATTNYLEIPASFMRGTLEIKVRGEVKLEMKCSRAGKQSSASSAAQWDATLALRTEVGGVKVAVTGSPKPLPTQTVWSGEAASSMFRNPQELLERHLPPVVDLEPVLQDLKSFEGVWAGCYPRLQGYALANPMFNAQGDLLLDLRIPSEPSVSAAGVRGSARSPGIGVGPRFPRLTQSRASSSIPSPSRTKIANGSGGDGATHSGTATPLRDGTFPLKELSEGVSGLSEFETTTLVSVAA